MNNPKRAFILFIVFIALLLGETSFAITANMLHWLDKLVAIKIILYIISLSFLFLSFLFFMRYLSLIRNVRQLRQENLYNLGSSNLIFNMYLFENRVEFLSHRVAFKNKKQYILAFTAGNQSVMNNTHKNDEIFRFNSEIANYITSIFTAKKTKFIKTNKYIYCFDKGVFFLYVFTDNEEDIPQIVKHLSDQMFRILEGGDYHIWVQPFFGICEIKEGTNLIENVDNALLARDISENNFETYSVYEEKFRTSTRYDDTKDIIQGLEEGQFVVYYQPKFSLTKKAFTSSEALVRWNHPRLGVLNPATFIEKAERAGLIHSIDTYVFEKVCEDLSEAKRKGHRLLPVSVNFSLYEFYTSSFLTKILETIDKYELPRSLIEVEITETTTQANRFLSISIIKKLREEGIRVLMDDFGSGYSGIESLREIPFDAIKIDKSFTDLINVDEKTRAIFKLLVELGHASNIEVVVEGVDNKEQVEFLRRVKADTIQGFYYSPALAKDEYEKFLRENEFEKGGKK